MPRNDRHPAAALVAAIAINGTLPAAVFAAGTDPVTTIFWRCVFGSAVVLPFLAMALRRRPRPGARALALAGAAGISLIASWLLYLLGFDLLGVAATTILYHVQPFFVLLLAAALFREPVGRSDMVWIAVAFAGVALASGVLAPRGSDAGLSIPGVAVVLAGALAYAVPTVLSRRLPDLAPSVTTACLTLPGALVLAPFAAPPSAIATQAWPWLVLIGTFHTGLSYMLIYGSVLRLPVAFAAVAAFLYPAIVLLLDWTLYGRQPGTREGAGLALILAATLGIRLRWRIGRRCPPRGGGEGSGGGNAG